MKTILLSLVLVLSLNLAQAKKVKPFYFPGTEAILEQNKASITEKGLNVDNQTVANFGKRIKSIYVYKIKEKQNAIRLEVKQPGRVERIEADFAKQPVEVKRFLKKGGKWHERTDVNEALIGR